MKQPALAALVLAGWVGVLESTRAEITVSNLTYNAEWRFNATGDTNSLVGWHLPPYDDTVAGWEVGTGLFGTEDATFYEHPINTPVLSTMQGGPNTVYFRTHFNWPSNNTGVRLLAGNLIDDGIVVYLNGTELYRYRVPANQNFSTLAVNQTAEGVFEITNVAAPSLLTGDNVLAVELHQSGTTSSDAVFGLHLVGLIPSPLTITHQPADLTVQARRRAQFTVGVSGSIASYQWFAIDAPPGSGLTNGPLAASTGSSPIFAISIANTNQNGIGFYSVVSNALGAVTSRVARLTVVPDSFGPRLVSAVVITNQPTTTNNISVVLVTFDESVRPLGAASSSNLLVSTLANGMPIPLSRLPQFSGNTVRVTTPELAADTDYVLTVNNVLDSQTSVSNVIAPDSQIAISFSTLTDVFPFGSTWQVNASETNDRLGKAWVAPNYDDTAAPWTPGTGMFSIDASAGFMPPCTIGQFPLNEARRTIYYRTKFDLLQTFGSNVTAAIQHLYDDGIVYYLNGLEIFRTNLPPAGPIDYFTLASVNVGNATNCQTLNLPIDGTLLRTGPNTLAVEVHQLGDPDPESDSAFDAALSFLHFRTPTLPAEPRPRVDIALAGASGVRISWSGHGWALEGSATVLGPWLEVQPMSTNMTVPISGPAQFFRLRKVN